MIIVINYGLGNVQAFVNVYDRLHIPVKIATNAAELRGGAKLVLPGVGSFDHAMNLFNRSGMRDEVESMVLGQKIPILGVCVGMQMLARSSDEGDLEGLGWVDGRVVAFESAPQLSRLPLPHMGWNDVFPMRKGSLFREFQGEAQFYFLHSYFFDCDSGDICLAEACYGINFACAIQKDNIFGVQFHPEKSHKYGIQLLKNFAES